MSMSDKGFIACGMYAFTDELRHAWQQLFNQFFELAEIRSDREIALNFNTGHALLREPNLFFGHTCGYPLMSHLKDYVTPFCVPIFDVSGTEGKLYSSRIIVADNSTIETLAECEGKIAAINNSDSNSGMNVFRHAVAQCNHSGRFFSTVTESGSHLQSLEAVASGAVDVAAIDCVSYQLIADQWPELIKQVRSIAFSIKTTGLPYVLPNSNLAETDTGQLLEQLNSALGSGPESIRERLYLRRFEAVGFDDYQVIVDVEAFAIDAGYPQLI